MHYYCMIYISRPKITSPVSLHISCTSFLCSSAFRLFTHPFIDGFTKLPYSPPFSAFLFFSQMFDFFQKYESTEDSNFLKILTFYQDYRTSLIPLTLTKSSGNKQLMDPYFFPYLFINTTKLEVGMR